MQAIDTRRLKFACLRTATLAVCASFIVAACGGGGSSSGGSTSSSGGTTTYTVGGTISGLSGTGLVISDTVSGNHVAVAANATSFTLTPAVASGANYTVTIATQPSSPSQTCTISGGSGTVGSANVTSVAITCTTNTYTVGGTVSGLTGTGLVLKDSVSGHQVTVAANATTFTLTPAVNSGSSYNVAVLTQPTSPSETCAVTGGTGTVGSAAVTGIAVTCTTGTFTVGGTISGLTGTGLVLKDSVSGHQVTVAANATTFTLTPAVSSGSNYNVAVLTQPATPSQTCTVTGGTGTGTVGSAAVTSIAVTCTTSTFTVGGTISGLTGTGLVLKDSVSGHQATVAANATTFTLTGAVNSGSAYNVSVQTAPASPPQLCTVATGSGTVTVANITSISVSCVNVGQYLWVTNPFDNGNGSIGAYTIDPATGALTAVATFPAVTANNTTTENQPWSVVVDPAGSYVYVANAGCLTYTTPPSTPPCTQSAGTISVFQNTAGSLNVLTDSPVTVGDAANQPFSLAIDPAGPYLFAGSNDAANGAVEAFTISSPGTLGAPTGYVTGFNSVTSVAVDYTHTYLFATDEADGAIYGYSIGAGGSLTSVGASFTTLAHPHGIAVHPTARVIYATDTSASPGTVNELSYDNTGALSSVNSYAVGSSPDGIAIDPTGKYLYVSNSGDNTVTAFTVAAGGSLTQIGSAVPVTAAPTPPILTPTAVAVDPSSQYLYVASGDSGTLSTFKIGAGGALSAVGSPISTTLSSGGPSSIAIE